MRWQQISTSISSMIASITRTQTVSGGEVDPAPWPPDLRLDIKKPSAGLPGRADNHARPVSLPKWPHPLAENHLALVWQVGEGVSPTLDANTK
jgi:hypothetical protein